jgi:hypothetical protein
MKKGMNAGLKRTARPAHVWIMDLLRNARIMPKRECSNNKGKGKVSVLRHDFLLRFRVWILRFGISEEQLTNSTQCRRRTTAPHQVEKLRTGPSTLRASGIGLTPAAKYFFSFWS